MRYHVNAKGEPGQCQAQHSCPFGDKDEHYATETEARQAYEVKSQTLIGAVDATAHTMFVMEKGLAKVAAMRLAIQKRIMNGKTEDRALDLQKLASLETRYHQGIAAVRRAFYAREMAWAHAAQAGLVHEDDRRSVFTQEGLARNKHALRTMHKRAKFSSSSPAYKEVAVEELAAWSGKTRQEAQQLLDGYSAYAAATQQQGQEPMDKDAYGVMLFQTHAKPQRIASVDIETNGGHPSYAEILEIGIVVKDENGAVVETVSERFGLEDPQVGTVLGIAHGETHGITAAAIANKPTFASPEVQARLGAILNDKATVVMAHNKPFENEFLNHYLGGYRDARQANTARHLAGEEPGAVMDTRALSAFIMHDTPNNRLESFTQGNNVAYEQAHAALPDATMTLEAFENFRTRLVQAPLGQRPAFSSTEA